jgi:hypothetical protein
VTNLIVKPTKLSSKLLGLLTFLSIAALIGTLLYSIAPFAGQKSCSFLKKARLQNQTMSSNNTSYCWALIGSNYPELLSKESAAGVRIKTFNLSWKKVYPANGVLDSSYLERKRRELSQLYESGFDVILLLGYHDVPGWVHEEYADSYYINQYGDRYEDVDNAGDANLVYNPVLQKLTAGYIQTIFSYFGTNFVAVRIGGGRYGELTYPPAKYANRTNCYWAFDQNAIAKSPVPNWRPGDPSPQVEAAKFLDTYLNSLVAYQNWQIATVRRSYAGSIMVLYPSWGMRPGDEDAAIRGNLSGSTSPEKNGEVQRGFDFARQVMAINDPNVIITTTWLDADASADNGSDLRYWSPVKYLAYLANRHPLSLPLFGENTGKGTRAEMDLSASQMERYHLVGMAWYNEIELFSGQYANLEDYRQVILKYSSFFRSYLLLSQSK